jgi:hypothetical protein
MGYYLFNLAVIISYQIHVKPQQSKPDPPVPETHRTTAPATLKMTPSNAAQAQSHGNA